jgi:hypothetical protein
MRFHALLNPYAWWTGVHYSAKNKRLCINFVPCVTICIVFEGGTDPVSCEKA